MATPEELLRKLDERFILGEIADEQYQQMRRRLESQIDGASAARVGTEGAAAPAGDVPAHAGGMDISDSVIKGNVTSGSASVGNIHINVGQGNAGGSSAELEYEKCVMLTLRSGGSLESIRKELDDCRLAIGLPIRLAREIEAACLESCGRKPVQGQGAATRFGPGGPDPLKRFFKSASESLASMFANAKPVQGGPPTNPTPANSAPASSTPASGKRPPPFPPPAPPRLAPWQPVPQQAANGLAPAAGSAAPASSTADSPAAHEANSVKEAIKEELRAGLKAELAQAAENDAATDGAVKPVKADEPAGPPMRKPPPLPAMPPPLRMPGPGKPQR